MPFEKGQSGNPGGRSTKEKPFRDALRAAIAEAGDDRRSLRRVARALLDTAVNGDVSAIREVADRLDGKVPQSIAGADGESPLEMIHRIERIIVDPQNPDGENIPSAT